MQLSKYYVQADSYRIPVLELLPDAPRSPAVLLCPGAGGDKYQVLENMARLVERACYFLVMPRPQSGRTSRASLGS